METVRQLLDEKGHSVASINADASVYDAIAKMAEKDIGSLVVMDGDKSVGLVTERDYARDVILKGRGSEATPVRDIMSSPVICVRPDVTVQEAMALMTDKFVRHLPVLESDGELVGIISMGDLVKAIIAEQQFMIEQLEHYITSGG